MGSKTVFIGLMATAAASPAMAQTATVIDSYPRQATPPPPVTGLPDPVREMVETAIATGDGDKVKTVIEIARRTYPDGKAELDKLETGFKANRQRIAAAEAARKREALRTAGPLEGWTGRGEFGALASTGNSEDVGVTAGFKASRVGINWRHAIRANFDYQRSNGDTTRERYLAAYEPNINISKAAFVYGLGQFERDKVQGFRARYSASSGIGYRFFDRQDLKLSTKLGPAWRKTNLVDPTTASQDDTYFAVLGGFDFEWKFAENWSITENATAFVSDASTYTSLTGVEAGIGKRLKARLSYSVEHDTDPPEDTKPIDTLSRISLIYDF